MKWNLRLAAANRGIWKASELQRMLADHGLVISAGKMSGLWSGNPASIKLADLDVICAVLGCQVQELLITEPVQVPVAGEMRRRLERLVARHSAQQPLVRRARIVLAAADGMRVGQIAACQQVAAPTVRRRLDRFTRLRIGGLFDEPRSGRPPVHGPSTRLLVLSVATSTPPEAETAWTHQLICTELAGRGLAVSTSTIGRTLAEAKVRPHKVKGRLNRADDAEFWQRAGAVCRLYLTPPPC